MANRDAEEAVGPNSTNVTETDTQATTEPTTRERTSI